MSEDINKEFNYSDKYYDDQNEYRHVTLPREFGHRVFKHFDGKLLAEEEWRSIGIEMSRGWVHYGYSPSEHHILLFYRKFSGNGVTPRVKQEQHYQKIIEERETLKLSTSSSVPSLTIRNQSLLCDLMMMKPICSTYNNRRGYHAMVSVLMNQFNAQQQQQHQMHNNNHHHHHQYKYNGHYQQYYQQQPQSSQDNIVDHLVSDLKRERRRNKRNKFAILLLFISLGLISYEFWQLRQAYDQRLGFEDLNKLFRNEPNRLEAYLPPWIQENLNKNKTSEKVDVESEEVKKWVNIAKTLKNQKEYEDAIRILENILWKYPSNFQARELYGLIFLDRAAYRQALRQFELAATYASSSNSEASCYNNIGVCFSRLKLDKEAVEAYDKALNIAQFDAKNRGLFYFNRAISHNGLGNLQLAIHDYTRAIQFDEHDHSFLSKKYKFRAICFSSLKQHQKALEDLNLSIQHYQEDKTSTNNPTIGAELYYFRAKTQRKLKNFEATIQNMDKSIELKKNDANYFHTRAVAFRKMGEYQKAEADHNKAIQLKPNNTKFKTSLEKTKNLALSQPSTQTQKEENMPPQEMTIQPQTPSPVSPPASENKAD